jgi:hypothetical protein
MGWRLNRVWLYLNPMYVLSQHYKLIKVSLSCKSSSKFELGTKHWCQSDLWLLKKKQKSWGGDHLRFLLHTKCKSLERSQTILRTFKPNLHYNILVVFRVIYNVNLNHRVLCKILAFHGIHFGFTIHIENVNFVQNRIKINPLAFAFKWFLHIVHTWKCYLLDLQYE